MKKGASVLEIGCGGGQMGRWVTELGLWYCGSDVIAVPIDEELQVYDGPNLVSDAHFLPLGNCSVDLVYSSAVTEHLACPVLAFQNVFRVLKPGGYFLGNCSFLEIWHANSYFHMTPLGIIEVLTCAGFEIDYVWPERGYSVFEAAVRMAFRGPFKCVFPIAALLSALYRLQTRMRVLKHRLTNSGAENPLMDSAKVAGAVAFIARKPSTT
ncbi:MAG: class I SAM-dependent methyltransferase [Candidatus Hydrogenedentes bacterium]|nr:class I SAM-dependent methyltransferase [Candidatus Hydrogenedentota bacterium]